MRRVWIIAVAIIVIGCAIVFGPRYFDQPPKGEGSYRAAERISRELATIKGKPLSDDLPQGYYRFTYDDGSWYVATGTDSHDGADGGTLGILTSDGDTAVFFTHICGKGEMPVTFFEKSPKEVIQQLRSTGKEYKRQQAGTSNGG